MRRSALAFIAAGLILAPAGLALSAGAPEMAQAAMPAARPVAQPAGAADFPNCPAPAVNGMNLRTTRGADGVTVTAFVVVQNVGQRSFFAPGGAARLSVAIGGRSLGSFSVERLSASEVKFFAVEARLASDEAIADLVATLDFADGAPVGRVAETLDCQTSDNRAVRRAPSIRAALDRAAG